jgi:hypothetical protein
VYVEKNWGALGQGLAVLTLAVFLAHPERAASTPVSASVSGTMIPSAAQIVDRALDVWTVNGGIINNGGKTAGY